MFLLAAAIGAVGTPRLSAKPLGGSSYQLTIEAFPGADDRAAQRLVTPLAVQLCGVRAVRFDRFTMTGEGKGPIQAMPHRFVQTISCVEPDPPSRAEVPTGFTPSPEEDRQAIAAAVRFFGRRDAGDAGESYAMLGPGMRALSSPAAWANDVARAKAFAPVERRFVAVSWEIDPPGVEPGAYAAIDFLGRSATEPFVCGYIVLKRTATGHEVTRTEESGPVVPAGKPALKRNELVSLIAALPCVVKPDPDDVLQPAGRTNP